MSIYHPLQEPFDGGRNFGGFVFICPAPGRLDDKWLEAMPPACICGSSAGRNHSPAGQFMFRHCIEADIHV
ncbi:hypothetical protein [Mesorhizobium sp.]|uniref:hypothetical protein n=1 Tax=Mesorhizobium sp. TaxID=1871066 RepID=UPI0011F53FC5|nr:hypothetical protein [Mesorhizobium sp.]TIN79731.1 MAG: hypothetical protein E5Y09_04625 [Mesorhizobium sp.]